MTTHAQSNASTTSETTIGFEAAILELEAIVSQMESGNLPLEQSISTYRRGAALVQTCQKSLTDAEQQVRILTEANKLEAFEPSPE